MKLSDTIKLELMRFFRFERKYNLVCSEGIHNADINAYNGTSLIEVEIKISKADFKKEFMQQITKENRWKVYKHNNYSDPKPHLMNGFIIPNRFYFCVPAEISEWAIEYLKDKNPKYGLLSYDTTRFQGHYHIISLKPAKNIHKEEPESRVLLQLARRASNELITAKENFINQKKELDALRKGIIESEEVQ